MTKMSIKVRCAHERSVVFSAILHSAQFLMRRKRSWRDGFDAVLFQSSAKREIQKHAGVIVTLTCFCSLFCLTAISNTHSAEVLSGPVHHFLFSSLPALLDQ